MICGISPPGSRAARKFSPTVQVSTGIIKGFTGVVTKPVKGAQKEGFGGFFKGVAQGAVGMIVQPLVSAIIATL